jgi:hypothetical protein
MGHWQVSTFNLKPETEFSQRPLVTQSRAGPEPVEHRDCGVTGPSFSIPEPGGRQAESGAKSEPESAEASGSGGSESPAPRLGLGARTPWQSPDSDSGSAPRRRTRCLQVEVQVTLPPRRRRRLGPASAGVRQHRLSGSLSLRAGRPPWSESGHRHGIQLEVTSHRRHRHWPRLPLPGCVTSCSSCGAAPSARLSGWAGQLDTAEGRD